MSLGVLLQMSLKIHSLMEDAYDINPFMGLFEKDDVGARSDFPIPFPHITDIRGG